MRVLTLNFIFLFFVSVHRDTGNQFFQGLPPCTMAYSEDHDNQIDIILGDDVEAMHYVTHVHISASGDYSPFYNPSGPGNNLIPGTTYTEPVPEIL
tara:strand:- start:965 stop:1252 length:288 start_codon:yes stop_codon:yes gene_type:complete